MAKWLTGLVAVVALIWGGWWWFGSGAAERGIIAGIEAARAQGWRIEYDDLSVVGFPSRFDTTVTDPRVTTPDGDILWSAPFVQAFALAYRPNHVIAVAPPEMTLDLPGNAIDITNEALRGSVIVTPSTTPVLDQSTVEGMAVRVALADLWGEAATALLATRQAGTETAHDVALSLSDITLSPAIRDLLDTQGQLPDRIDAVKVEAEIGLTDAVGPGRQPIIQTVLLRRGEIVWGDIRADLTGEVAVDADGRPDGALTLALEGWEPLMAGAVAQGLLTTGEAAILNAGVAGLAGNDGIARVPVTVSNGTVSVFGLQVVVLPPS
ncbi:DUF2125 domain-containing protein [Jannaschia donghaensis]|uniref:DUF2125 domain-containing protein n=1 Tax=Jannaschia donghaensis TaxID=420998 RepID=A0A0M6YF67_9RHOB|nr:DUF2125 domain-containing protein [Jannaschia donghaensis]CTQ48163.1 hypothetical protein JDO7802_00165 [Jannaschia donghaensis]